MARRHLLIGIGPGAIAAAEAIRGADAGAEIVVVGADPHGYYSRPGLAYYLAKESRRSGSGRSRPPSSPASASRSSTSASAPSTPAATG